jgi:hypothetical protein
MRMNGGFIPADASTTTSDGDAGLPAVWLSCGHWAFHNTAAASVPGRALPPQVFSSRL